MRGVWSWVDPQRRHPEQSGPKGRGVEGSLARPHGGLPTRPARLTGRLWADSMQVDRAVSRTGEWTSDRTLLATVDALYRTGGLHHPHFSAFGPIRDTPLEAMRAVPAVREQRLYQADHLNRRYGFGTDEIVFDATGHLPQAHDPRLAWALVYADRFPLATDTTSYDDLLRVPGIGPLVAHRVINLRAAPSSAASRTCADSAW